MVLAQQERRDRFSITSSKNFGADSGTIVGAPFRPPPAPHYLGSGSSQENGDREPPLTIMRSPDLRDQIPAYDNVPSNTLCTSLVFDVDTGQRPLYGFVRVVSLGYTLD